MTRYLMDKKKEIITITIFARIKIDDKVKWVS